MIADHEQAPPILVKLFSIIALNRDSVGYSKESVDDSEEVSYGPSIEKQLQFFLH